MSLKRLLQRYLPNIFPGNDDSSQASTEPTIVPVPVEIYEASEAAQAPTDNRRRNLITMAISGVPMVCWMVFVIIPSSALGLIAVVVSVASFLLILRRIRPQYQEHELSTKAIAPSSRVGRYLVKEKLLREMRRHPICVLHWWALLGLAQASTALAIITVGHAGVFGILWVILTGFAGWKLIGW